MVITNQAKNIKQKQKLSSNAKRFEHKTEIICLICQQEIHKDDNYLKVVDYKTGEVFKTGYYHNSCWQQRLNNIIADTKSVMIAKTNTLLDRALNLMG